MNIGPGAPPLISRYFCNDLTGQCLSVGWLCRISVGVVVLLCLYDENVI